MFKWLHHILEPHCPECKAERLENKVCQSCEMLQYEVDRLRSDNERLLNRLLEKPEAPQERVEAPQPLTLPRRVPWAVKRQMLEAEDREKARILKQAPKPDAEIEALEEELGVVERAREAENASAK